MTSGAADRGARRAVFPLFDSLRAIAALSVFAYHTRLFASPPEALQPYIARLDIGVTIFFLISGFLLYRPFARARLRREPALNIPAYAWRRGLRIVPAYWVALLLIGLWFGLDAVLGSDAPIYFGFVQIYFPSHAISGIGQAWSLCVELTFYAFLPIWAWGLRRIRVVDARQWLRTELVGLVVLAFLSYAYKEWVLLEHLGEISDIGQYALPRYFDLFALGMGLAVASVWLEGRPLPRLLRPLDRFPSIAWGAAFVAFWAVSTQIGLAGRTVPSAHLGRHYLYAVAAFLLLVPAVIGNQRRGVLRQILASKTLLWIGLVSYAVYLWQLAVLDKLAEWGVSKDIVREAGGARYFVVAAVALALTLAIAAASYYVVERPALRLKAMLPRTGSLPSSEALRLGGAVAGASALGVLAIIAADVAPAAVRGVFVVCAVLVLALIAPALLRRAKARSHRRVALAICGIGLAAAAFALFRLAFPAAGGVEPAQGKAKFAPAQHIVAVNSGKSLILYVNGRFAGYSKGVPAVDRTGSPVEIGAGLGKSVWNGRIDDVAIYRTALDAPTVEAHFALGSSDGRRYAEAIRSTPGLAGYWRLGEASGPARDTAGSDRHIGTAGPGVIRGAPGLIAGDPNAAIAIRGRRGSVVIPGFDAEALRRRFTVEAWATAAPGADRRLVARPGAFSVGTDSHGRWSFAVRRNGVLVSVGTGKPAAPDPKASTASGSLDGALLVASLGMLLGGLLALRFAGRADRPGTSNAAPARTLAPGDGPAGT